MVFEHSTSLPSHTCHFAAEESVQLLWSRSGFTWLPMLHGAPGIAAYCAACACTAAYWTARCCCNCSLLTAALPPACGVYSVDLRQIVDDKL